MGQGFSPRGEKGRYVLPADFRKAIAPAETSARVLCVTKHDRWNCLVGFGIDRMDSFEALLDQQEQRADKQGAPFDRELRSMQLMNCAKLSFDASGRFILPEHLSGLCGISGSLAFLGGSPFFTMWAPEEIYSMGPGFEAQQAMVRAAEADAKKGKGK